MDFDWLKVPKVDQGNSTPHPLSEAPGSRIQLASGRTIRLTALHQYYVYENVLCGVPREWASQIVSAIEAAERLFPNHTRTPAVLEPVVYMGVTGEETAPPPTRWFKLPGVCSIASFKSNEPARDSGEVYSTAVVIWFQDRYGLGLDQRTIEQIEQLNWEKYGMDWTH